MKKLTLALLVAGFAANAVAQVTIEPKDTRGTAATQAQKDNTSKGFGTLTVNGKVIDQTCEVKSGYKHLVVVLPTVGHSSLKVAGDATGWQPFSIELENCSATFTPSAGAEKVFALFAPSFDDLDTDNNYTLKNRLEGANEGKTGVLLGAKKVNIQLTDKEGNALKIGKDTPTIDSASNTATFKPDTASYEKSKVEMKTGSLAYTIKYGAQYYATGEASPGEVQAFTTYSIAYE